MQTLTLAIIYCRTGETRGAQTLVRPGGVYAFSVDAARVARLGTFVDVRASLFGRPGITGQAGACIVAHHVHALRVRTTRR